LECGEICRFDAHVRQAAKAGVDAVDRLASREYCLDRSRASRYGTMASRIEGYACAAIDHAPMR
jgi:hypothetical protein